MNGWGEDRFGDKRISLGRDCLTRVSCGQIGFSSETKSIFRQVEHWYVSTVIGIDMNVYVQ